MCVCVCVWREKKRELTVNQRSLVKARVGNGLLAYAMHGILLQVALSLEWYFSNVLQCRAMQSHFFLIHLYFYSICSNKGNFLLRHLDVYFLSAFFSLFVSLFSCFSVWFGLVFLWMLLFFFLLFLYSLLLYVCVHTESCCEKLDMCFRLKNCAFLFSFFLSKRRLQTT